MDNDVNQNIQKGGDGFFDAIEGITIIKDKGLLIFPTNEPFENFFLKNSEIQILRIIVIFQLIIKIKNMFIMNFTQKKHQLKSLLKK